MTAETDVLGSLNKLFESPGLDIETRYIRLWGPWSPIHLLSLFTLAIVPLGLMRARRHDVGRHRAIMLWTYGLALVAAGLFTLAPGRIMHAALFGQ